MVDISTSTVPAASPSTAPPGPKSTSVTAGGSVSIVMTTSAPATASAGVAAVLAPARTSGAARSAVRFHTIRS